MEGTGSKNEIIAEYYSRHYEELKNFVRKRLAFDDATEDIVQHVFLRLLSFHKMITEVTLPCLVYTTARNLICDFWRHRRTIEEYEHYIISGDVRQTFGADAESVYSAHEITNLLEQGIARLTDKQQAVYSLNIYEGLRVSEISKRLGINYKSAENGLGIARKEVRSYIRKELRMAE